MGRSSFIVAGVMAFLFVGEAQAATLSGRIRVSAGSPGVVSIETDHGRVAVTGPWAASIAGLQGQLVSVHGRLLPRPRGRYSVMAVDRFGLGDRADIWAGTWETAVAGAYVDRTLVLSDESRLDLGRVRADDPAAMRARRLNGTTVALWGELTPSGFDQTRTDLLVQAKIRKAPPGEPGYDVELPNGLTMRTQRGTNAAMPRLGYSDEATRWVMLHPNDDSFDVRWASAPISSSAVWCDPVAEPQHWYVLDRWYSGRVHETHSTHSHHSDDDSGGVVTLPDPRGGGRPGGAPRTGGNTGPVIRTEPRHTPSGTVPTLPGNRGSGNRGGGISPRGSGVSRNANTVPSRSVPIRSPRTNAPSRGAGTRRSRH